MNREACKQSPKIINMAIKISIISAITQTDYIFNRIYLNRKSATIEKECQIWKLGGWIVQWSRTTKGKNN